ncbi:MAG: hypothetical protein ACHBN1_21350 [Heteroscytonema crispum UTEX LB 1556]
MENSPLPRMKTIFPMPNDVASRDCRGRYERWRNNAQCPIFISSILSLVGNYC